MKYNPKTFRKKAIDFVSRRNHAGLFLTPGYGKTAIMEYLFYKLKKQKKVKRMIVVSKRKIIVKTWQDESAKWGFDFKFIKISSTNELHKLTQDADIYLFSFDVFARLFTKRGSGTKFNGKVIKGQMTLNNIKLLPTTDMLVLDEGTRIKNYSERTKRILLIAPLFERRYSLTGSPSTKNYIDFFYQIKFLDGGKALGTRITQFRNKYFKPTGFKGKQFVIENAKAASRLLSAIKPIVLAMGDENLDLPDLVPSVREVILDADTYIDKYLELEREACLEIKGKTILSSNAGVNTSKLRQLANGFIYHKKQGTKIKKAIDVHDTKLDEAIEIVESMQGSPILIAFEFGEDKKRLLKQFPNAKVIDGATTDKQQEQIETDWNNGEIEVLLGQYSAIAHGLNLQDGGCNTILCYGLTYVFEDFEQVIRRIRRPSTEKKNKRIFLIMLITKGTVEERVLENLTEKDTNQTKVYEGLSDYVKEQLTITDINKEKVAVKYRTLMQEYDLLENVYFELKSKSRVQAFAGRIVDNLCMVQDKDLEKFYREMSKIVKQKKSRGGSTFACVKTILFYSLSIIENNSGTYTMLNEIVAKKFFSRTELKREGLLK